MKKVINVLLLAVSLSLSLVCSSCGSQMERDATAVAKRAVEYNQELKRYESGSRFMGKPMSKHEFEEYTKEYTSFCNQMLEKYGETPEMHKEFTTMVNEKIKELEK